VKTTLLTLLIALFFLAAGGMFELFGCSMLAKICGIIAFLLLSGMLAYELTN
jgi:hypothetical protein